MKKKKMKNRQKEAFVPMLLALFVLGAALPAPMVWAEESGQNRLVVEVIEDIPADERVMIEDQQVPLAGNITPAPESGNQRRNRILWLLLILMAAVFAVLGYRRAGLIRLRRDGYREEEKILSQKSREE